MFKTLLKLLVLFGIATYLVFALTMLHKNRTHQVCTGLTIVITPAMGGEQGEAPTQPDCGFVNENEVRQILISKKIFPEGRPLYDIDLSEIEEALVANQNIDDALCYKTADGQISIRITPRRPVLHVLNQQGEDFYIDNQGAVMARGHHQIDLIVMTGNVPRNTAGPRYAKLGVILSQDEFWGQQIQEIHVTPQGEMHITPKVGQHTIILGDTSDIEDKLRRMKTFYTEGLDKVGWNIYHTINLKYSNQIICTRSL